MDDPMDDTIETWVQRCRDRSEEFAEFSLILDDFEKEYGELLYDIITDIYINDEMFAIEPDNLVVFLEELFEHPENGQKFMSLPFGATAEMTDLFGRMNWVVDGLVQLWSAYPDAPTPEHILMSIEQFSDDRDLYEEIGNFIHQFQYSEQELRAVPQDFWTYLYEVYSEVDQSIFRDNVVMFAMVHMQMKFKDSRIQEILKASTEQNYALSTRDAINISHHWYEIKKYPLSWAVKLY